MHMAARYKLCNQLTLILITLSECNTSTDQQAAALWDLFAPARGLLLWHTLHIYNSNLHVID
jgi:hypothetical protein